MSRDLAEIFPIACEAPGGVEHLKGLILDSAIRGGLTSAMPGDTPAMELLREVAVARAALLKQRLMKDVQPAALGDPSFQVPSHWGWTRLGLLLSKMGAGSTPLGGKTVYTDDGVPFLRSQNIWNHGVVLDDVARIPRHVHVDMAGTHVQPGDVLLNITGASIARCAVVDDDFAEANVSQHVAILRLIDKRLRRFLHVFLTSPTAYRWIMAVQVGISREGLSMMRLKDCMVPVPPLEEQDRIVARVNELMALCDELEAKQTQQRKVRVSLNDACLDRLLAAEDADEFAEEWARIVANFDVLYDDADNVVKLKQGIVHLAVMGKMTPSSHEHVPPTFHHGRVARRRSAWLKDRSTEYREPAWQRPLLPSIPPGWQWEHLGLLGEDALSPVQTGPFGAQLHKEDYVDSGVPLIAVGNLTGTGFTREGLYFIPQHKADQLARYTVRAGDLLFARSGATLGKVCVAPDYVDDWRMSGHILRLRLDKSVMLPAFAMLALWGARPVVSQVQGGVQGTTRPGFNTKLLEQVCLPVPPIAEQSRIVAAIGALFERCDTLLAGLAARADAAESVCMNITSGTPEHRPKRVSRTMNVEASNVAHKSG